MAKNEKDFAIKFDGVTLDEEPEKYLKMIFAEASDYQEEKLRDINVENRFFFEGNDEQLDARSSDEAVIRSSIFINEVKPAIETRVAGVLTKIEETGAPIIVKPRSKNPTPEEKDQAKWMTLTLTDQLRDSGYLSDIFEEQIVGSEIFRSPSAVKVGWEKETVRVPTVIEPTEQDITSAAAVGQPIPERRVEYRDQQVGRPYVEWLDPDEFLYDPHASSLERDCSYTIHYSYMFYHDLLAMAHEQGWNVDKIKEFRDGLDETDIENTKDDSIRDSLREGRDGGDPDRGFRDGKMLVAEFYIKTYSELGAKELRKFAFIGNKEIVFDEVNTFEEITHPFVIARSNPLPGTLENFSSVDITKRMGRFINEVYNSWVDGTVYSMFTIQKADANAQFTKPPVYGPGEIWYVSPDKESIAPVNPFQVQIPELTSLLTFMSSRLRQVLNSPDLAEGFNATPNEKATSSKLRSAGSARRFVPINRRYGEALVSVATMFLKLNRQFADDAVNWVLDVDIDAPTLTNITDVDRAKEEEMVLLAQMLENPLYQNPNGLRKIRNQMEDLVRAIKDNHANVADYVPSTDELDSQIDIDTQRQNLQVEMAGAAQEQQIAGGQANG